MQAMYFTKGIKKGVEIRQKIARAKTEEEIIKTIKEHIEK
jgi:hypothetical protein